MMRALLVALLAAGAAARARAPATGSAPYRRRLTGGAMTELNRLLGELTFNIPDQQFTIVTPTIAVKDIDTTITGLSCTKLGIGALDFRAAKPDEQQVDLAITVSGITAECSCDWSYVYIWDGKGTARAVATAANANRLSTSVTFRSADFSTSLPIMYPPPEVGSCGIDFHFQPMKFDGKNVGGDLVQLFDGTVQDKIEDQLNSIACTSLGDLVPNLLATVIAALNEEIEPLMYFMNLTFARDDALISERQLVDTAECTARSCPFPWLLPSLVQMRQNWIVNMLQLGAVKLNSPSRPSCKPDWQGATRCSGPLVVNDVISFITGGTGSVVIANFFDLFQWNSTIVSGDETFSEEIRIKSLKITGLDTFTRFDTMHVIGNFTVMNALTMEYLGVEVDADVVLRPSADDSSTVVSKHGAISEHVILHTGLRNASVELAGMLAIFKTATEIKLGDMAQHPLGCIFAKVYDANLTFANVTVGGVTHPTFQGFTGVDSLLNGVADAAFLMYEEVAEKILPGAMQTSVRASLNNLTAMYLAAPENLVCPPRPRSASLVYMDFTKENVTLELAWLLNQGIGAENVNIAIGSVTKATSGTNGLYVDDQKLVDSTTTMRDDPKQEFCISCSRIGSIKLQVANLSVSGLDTITAMQILAPTAPHTLHNDLELGTDPQVGVSVDIALRVDGSQLQIDDVFTLSVDLKSIHFLLDILLMIDEGKFWAIPIGSLAEAGPYLSTLAAARPQRLQLDFARVGLSVRCKKCSSPLLREMAANLERESDIEQLTGVTNAFLANLGRHFTQDKKVQLQYEMMLSQYSEEATQMALNKSGCVDLAGPSCKLMASTLACMTDPVYMSRHCRMSCGVCAPPPPAAPPIPETVFGVAVVLAIILGVMALVGCCLPFCSKKTMKLNTRAIVDTRRRSGGDDTDVVASSLRVSLLDSINAPREIPIYAHTKSIFTSPHVSSRVKVLVPLCLCCNIGLFISGHAMMGAAVDLNAQLAGDAVQVNPFVQFSLGKSLSDMYEAEAYFLTVFVGGFSGIWPYTKLLTMLFCWFKPLSPETRGSVLEKLDYAGVWSLIDLFVLVMCMLGYRLHITSPRTLDFVPVDFYVVDLMVSPVWGIYGFMLGVISSIILNYICLHAHRQATRGAAITLRTPSLGEDEAVPAASWIDAGSTDVVGQRAALVGQKERLADHVFEGRGLYYRFTFTKSGRRWIPFLLSLAALLMVIGALVPSFQLKVHGISGVFLDMGDPGASLQEYSLVSSAAKVASQPPRAERCDQTGSCGGGSTGLHTIALVYLCFGLFVPLAVLVVVAVQWQCSLTLKAQKRLFVFHEALSAWSALEVFILSVVIAMFEIGDVSDKIVGDACRGLTDWLGDFVTFGLLDSDDATCFHIVADTNGGMALLVLAAIVSSVSCRVVTKLTREAIIDRERRIAGDDPAQAEEGSSKAPQAGCGEQLMQCCLVALGAVRTWDKSWDSDYAGAPPADKSGAEPRSGAKWFDDIMNSGSANAGASTAALPASSSDGAAAAPAGWVVMEWHNRKYHWNQLTGETRWAQPQPQPEPEPEPQAEQPLPAPTTAAEAAELARQAVELDGAGDPRAAATYRAAADWMGRQDGERFAGKAAEYHARAEELEAAPQRRRAME